MNHYIQSSAMDIARPSPWTIFLMAWTSLGVAIMKERGYAPLHLHDCIEFVKVTR